MINIFNSKPITNTIIEETPVGYAPNEKIESKKTSTLGYFFLLLMVIGGVWQGNLLIFSIQDNVKKVSRLSSCFIYSIDVNSYGGNNAYYGNYYQENNTCIFSEIEIKNDIPRIYADINIFQVENEDLRKQISNIGTGIYNLERDKTNLNSSYTNSLLEDINKNKTGNIYNSSTQGNKLTDNESMASSLKEEKSKLEQKIKNNNDKIKVIISDNQKQIKEARDEYNTELFKYQLKVFAVALVLVLPLFLFTWKRYSRAKNSNSEYALIWGGLLAVTSLLTLQLILTFIYYILPHNLLLKVLAFLQNFSFLITVLYWLGFIAVPLFFGGMIYLIQKKYYNIKAVTMRAIKNGECPKCEMKINKDQNYCPVCSYRLKDKCQACSSNTSLSGDYCESCGALKVKDAAKPAA